MCALHKEGPDQDEDVGVAVAAINPPPVGHETALFLDVDGTLLEIAARPELVQVPPTLPILLDRVAAERRGALALVSGRPLSDIDRLFAPWRGAAAGVHGAERRCADGSVVTHTDSAADLATAKALNRLRPLLAQTAGRIPGVWLEDKGRTLAVHYRAVPERGPEILDLARQLVPQSDDCLRLIAGKMVVELQPRFYGKDGAIAAFMAEPPFQGRVPVFIGDDTTDEDGFAEVNRLSGVSIRIGTPAPTAAVYALPSVSAALKWLAAG
jgi:trehalose 6-phosphate phosphatase